MATAISGNLVFFAGGISTFTYLLSTTVDIWDTVSKTWKATTCLSVSRYSIEGMGNGGLVLFAGGENDGGIYYDTVDIYTPDSAQSR